MGSPEPPPATTTHPAQVSRETGKLGELGNEGVFT
jgi:hypothetical protein